MKEFFKYFTVPAMAEFMTQDKFNEENEDGREISSMNASYIKTYLSQKWRGFIGPFAEQLIAICDNHKTRFISVMDICNELQVRLDDIAFKEEEVIPALRFLANYESLLVPLGFKQVHSNLFLIVKVGDEFKKVLVEYYGPSDRWEIQEEDLVEKEFFFGEEMQNFRWYHLVLKTPNGKPF